MLTFNRPTMKVYLAGYMSGEKLKECTEWRIKIRKHYQNWKGAGNPYPISFLDPFNGPELETIDSKGLTSNVPSKAIIQGDYMSVCHADLVVANLDTFEAERPSIGTHWELAWTWEQKKPFILIVPKDKTETYTKHPFTGQAAFVFDNVDDFLKEKCLNYFYKRIAGASY